MNEYPKISGNTELRMAYSFLSLAVETALPIDFIVAVKRAIRKYNHRQTDYGIRAIWSDGESCVYLVALPETIDSKEGAKSYFEDVEYRPPINSPYDCSGLVSYCLLGRHSRLGTAASFMGYTRVSNPKPGDICCNDHHCGIYIGDGQMIHAPRTGDVVKISAVHSGMIYTRY